MQKRILDILQNTQKVIIGKERVTKLLLTALLADGHVLLEDVPGTGKTRLAKALAASLGIEFGRIQFTPDMLPADITENGFLVPVDDSDALADRLTRLLENPDLMQQMGKNAAKLQAEYLPEKVNQEWADYFQKVAGKKKLV